MKVQLIGKQHSEGVSRKTGKPYNFNIAHVVRSDKDVDGMVGDRVYLDPNQYPLDSLVVGSTYDLDYNNRGFVADFRPAK